MSYVKVEQRSEEGRIFMGDLSQKYAGPNYDLSDVKILVNIPSKRGDPISYFFWDMEGVIPSTHPQYSTLERLFK